MTLTITKNLSKTSLWLAAIKTSQQFIIAQPLFRWRQNVQQPAPQISHSSEFLSELFCILEHSRHGLFHSISLLFLLDGLEPSLFPPPQRVQCLAANYAEWSAAYPLCFLFNNPQEMVKHWKSSPINKKRKKPSTQTITPISSHFLSGHGLGVPQL